jgi:hypothetical protein
MRLEEKKLTSHNAQYKEGELATHPVSNGTARGFYADT